LTRIGDAAKVRLTMLAGVPHQVGDLIAYVPPTTPAVATTASTLPAHPSQTAHWWHTKEFVEHAMLCCSAPH
jgi:hypothetical protein